MNIDPQSAIPPHLQIAQAMEKRAKMYEQMQESYPTAALKYIQPKQECIRIAKCLRAGVPLYR